MTGDAEEIDTTDGPSLFALQGFSLWLQLQWLENSLFSIKEWPA